MTQEGCDKARLPSHPNDVGSAESQLGHKNISNKQTHDPNGTRPPRPDQPPGKRSRTKPAHTQNIDMQHRGRTQPQPVHLNHTQPRKNSVAAKSGLLPHRDDVSTSATTTVTEGKQGTEQTPLSKSEEERIMPLRVMGREGEQQLWKVIVCRETCDYVQ